jgi:hypothetical protein
MTTPLLKPVTRITTSEHRGKKMVVTLQPGDTVRIRHERSRDFYEVPLSWVYDAGAKAQALATMEARRRK